jgi:hypothetical protein
MTLQQSKSAMKAAMVCGIISAFITLCAAAVGISRSGTEFGGMKLNGLLLIDVGLMVGLTIGIHFRSRICAVTMFVYFILSKCMQGSALLNPGALVSGLAFMFFYGRGAWASIVYHRETAAGADDSHGPGTTTDPEGAAQPPRLP